MKTSVKFEMIARQIDTCGVQDKLSPVNMMGGFRQFSAIVESQTACTFTDRNFQSVISFKPPPKSKFNGGSVT